MSIPVLVRLIIHIIIFFFRMWPLSEFVHFHTLVVVPIPLLMTQFTNFASTAEEIDAFYSSITLQIWI